MSGLEAYRLRVSAQKRRDILEAAWTIFGDEGYEKAGMSDIAARANVSTATLYKHFESKEKLFAETVQHVAKTLGQPRATKFYVEACFTEPPILNEAQRIGCAAFLDFLHNLPTGAEDAAA